MEHAQRELLRRLTLSDELILRKLICEQSVGRQVLDEKTGALVRLAGLVAMEASVTSFQWAVDAALAAGADDAEIVDILLAVAPLVGLSRVGTSARALSTALGYQPDLGR